MFNQINMSDPYTFYVFITSFISLFFCFSQGTVVKVSGVLLCNDKPLLNVPVEMWEKDCDCFLFFLKSNTFYGI
jgi:hypothetical protein